MVVSRKGIRKEAKSCCQTQLVRKRRGKMRERVCLHVLVGRESFRRVLALLPPLQHRARPHDATRNNGTNRLGPCKHKRSPKLSLRRR
jgi:hypothetical protein